MLSAEKDSGTQSPAGEDQQVSQNLPLCHLLRGLQKVGAPNLTLLS